PDSDPESLTPELTLDNSMPSETMQPVESHDAAIEMKELGTVEKLDWQEYLENYSNNWQDGAGGGGGGGGEEDEERRSALENDLTRKTSLEDHLMWQLRMSALNDSGQSVGAT